jgi:transposase-like protein/IS1 family transposase
MWLFPAEIKRRKAMTCIRCQHTDCVKAGSFGKRRVQRWKCTSCKNRFSEPHTKLTRDTFTSQPDAAERALHCLLEGCSIRSTERLTGLNRNTIMRLLLVAGERSARLMDGRVRGLSARYLQCDEIWCYVGKKRRNVRTGDSPEMGDQWIFVAMDAETKLVTAFRIGKRSWESTSSFMRDLYERMAENRRTQITTDGFHFYKQAVADAFGLDADFAQLTKMFGDYGQFDGPDARYSPPRISGVISKVRQGDPDPRHISTSFVERQNLTMRMAMRRFTRLTNAFSKKLSHLKAAVALHFAYYNFCRVHSSLRVTPAMEAGLADHVWSIAELLRAE